MPSFELRNYGRKLWASAVDPVMGHYARADRAGSGDRITEPLEIDVATDDPKAYTKPWTVRVNQRIMLDNEWMEFICLENQKFLWFLKGQK